jgi:ABC-type lipoprotein export system ATPase subunit
MNMQAAVKRAELKPHVAPAPARPVVVETRKLKKTYFSKVNVPVLRGIDMQVRGGEFVTIVGQSGSGKSTLLNIIGALDTPTSGTVLINGKNIAKLNVDELAALRNEEIGFVFQSHSLLDEFTCLENALMPLTIKQGAPTEAQRRYVISLLERIGLGDQLHKRPDEMSGGQNQRCAVVRALANLPIIVLADEPTGILDSRSGQDVFAMMREMNRESGVAFLMITHDERLARAADRELLIEDGLIHEVNRTTQSLRTVGLR